MAEIILKEYTPRIKIRIYEKGAMTRLVRLICRSEITPRSRERIVTRSRRSNFICLWRTRLSSAVI